MLTSRITGEKRNYKTNTDHHNGDLNVFFFVRFTHLKWLTFKALI